MLRSAIAKNLLAGSAGRVITAFTPLLLVPLMIRAWGIHLYGEWLILTAIPTYLMIAPDFGLAGAVVNEMAIRAVKRDIDAANRLYRSAWMVLFLAGLTLTAVGTMASTVVRWSSLGISTMKSIDVMLIVAACCIQILAMQHAFLISGVYKAAARNARFAMMQTVTSIAFLLGSVVLLLIFDANPVVYAIGSAAIRIAVLPLLVFDARRVFPAIRLGIRDASLSAVRPYFAPGMGHAGMPLVNALQNQGVVFAIGVILGPASVATFQTVRVLSNGIRSVLSIPSAAIGLELSALIGEGRTETIRKLLVRNSQLALGVALSGCALMAMFGDAIYRAWLHGRAEYSVAVALLLFASQIPCAIGSSFTIMLIAANQIHRAIGRLTAVAVVSLAVVAVGAMVIGLIGAAAGVIVWETGIAAVTLNVAVKRAGLSGRAFVRDFIHVRHLHEDVAATIAWLRSALGLTRSTNVL